MRSFVELAKKMNMIWNVESGILRKYTASRYIIKVNGVVKFIGNGLTKDGYIRKGKRWILLIWLWD